MLNEFITDIVSGKTGKLLDFPENEIAFNPFITQRIISMYSPQLCNIINETTNKKLPHLSKVGVYNLLLAIVPKQKRNFTKYFKKESHKLSFTEKDKKNIDFLCERNKVSYREVEKYIIEFDLELNVV